MSNADRPLTIADYPLAEKRPELVRSLSGKPMAEVTLDSLLAGEVTMEDLRIEPAALRRQAEIARDAGRPTLAQNFERAADLVPVPQEIVMRAYDLLRPGRARTRQDLDDMAALLRRDYGADTIAAFIEEAAAVYEKRGLFTFRF